MSDRYITSPVGFARTNREPLDKYEKFNSLSDAVQYAKSGAAYTGQHVVVTFGSENESNYAFYIVTKARKLRPVISNNSLLSNSNNELITIDGGLIKWLLVYYHDTTDTYSENEIGSSLVNPYKFSILDQIELFRNSNGSFNFLLYKNGEENKWTQDHTILTAGGTGSAISGNITNLALSSTSDKAFVENASNADYVSVCPKTTSSDVIELYVDATEYFGGE